MICSATGLKVDWLTMTVCCVKSSLVFMLVTQLTKKIARPAITKKSFKNTHSFSSEHLISEGNPFTTLNDRNKPSQNA